MFPRQRALLARNATVPTPMGYLLAVLMVALALAVHLSLGPVAYRIPFLTFFAAVILSSWVWGAGPGLLSGALSLPIVTYFFIPPYNSLQIADAESALQLALFTLVVLLITGLSYTRGQAESRLFRERAKLEATLAGIGDAALATDIDGHITFINGVASSLTGWTQEEAIGKPVDQVLHLMDESTRALIPTPAEQVLRDGKAVELANHTILVARDGTERPIDDSASPILSKGGRTVGMVMVFRDVSERREAEQAKARLMEALERERKRLDDLLSSVPSVVWEAWGKPDEDSQSINFVSSYVEQMLGYTREEWLSTPNFWLTIVHPDDKEEAARRAAETYVGGEGGTNRFRWITRDGRVLWVESNNVVIKDSSGTPVGLRGVTIDLSERKQAEDETRSRIEVQKAMLETMVEGIPIGVALLDGDARIMSLNAEWARMTNVDLSSRGRSIYSLGPSFAERRKYYEKALSGEAVYLSDVPYTVPGDEVTYYRDIHLMPVRDADEEIVGMLNAVVDVTQRHELDKQKDALLALASHELKTPITTIKGYAQLALRGVADEKQRRILSTIDEQANRLTRLINDMLEVSRIQNDSLSLQKERHDLGDIVSDVAENLSATAPDFTITTEIGVEPAPIFADRVRIEQVVTNLLQNALKYSGSSRQVDVRLGLAESNDALQVSVRDRGVGIPANQLGHVFERFFRASNVTTEGVKGLGLGLYISSEIIAHHNGRIWCESKEGAGSTFYFTLPLDKDS